MASHRYSVQYLHHHTYSFRYSTIDILWPDLHFADAISSGTVEHKSRYDAVKILQEVKVKTGMKSPVWTYIDL